MVGEEGGNRSWDVWMASLTQWIWFEQPLGHSEGREAGVLQSTDSQRVRHNLATKQQQPVREDSSVQFSHSVMSDSLQPHGLQHTRLPCPSPTPGSYSNSCLSSWWCHPTISSSVEMASSEMASSEMTSSVISCQGRQGRRQTLRTPVWKERGYETPRANSTTLWVCNDQQFQGRSWKG